MTVEYVNVKAWYTVYTYPRLARLPLVGRWFQRYGYLHYGDLIVPKSVEALSITAITDDHFTVTRGTA